MRKHFKPLSNKKVKKFRTDLIRYGFQPELEMIYCSIPYENNNGIKMARKYISGIGFQQQNAIMFLR